MSSDSIAAPPQLPVLTMVGFIAVWLGLSRPNVGTHVLLYVDGKIETVSRRALREVRREVEKAEHGVWIGRNVTYRRSDPEHAHGGFFRGEVDEVFIFDAVLGQREVRRLMESNRTRE